MAEPVAGTTPRYLKTPDAAIHLGLSARTLEKHRCYGTGPVFRKLGGRIVYAIDDLDAWAALGIRRSTSDPGNGTVHPAKRLPTDCVRR
ncbi:transcriptional regulator [Croceicoccus estronivorus]|uniref:helix-turn-helix transcriptional regulator n=1 Tax=Croceicoccus estronivorus TaxID=1172626 RepID=UPI00082C7DF8|nr:helix-turn-helix domain-containing protein [Croceicoccus estronivorus]OCC23808.1 transcriptional regulator [Croceicoccus estronivorus]